MKLFHQKYQFWYGCVICCAYTALLLGLEIFLRNGSLNNDAYFYIQSAESARSQGFVSWYNKLPTESQYPPLLLICMVFLTESFSLSVETSGRLCNVTPCLVAAVGVFCCCNQLYKKTSMALATALLVMSLPSWFKHGSGIIRDPLFWMETVWLFVMIISAKDFLYDAYKKLWLTIGIGVMAGLMLLTRKEAIMLIIPGMILFFGELSDLYRKPFNKWCYHFLLCILAFLIANIIAFLPYFNGLEFIPFKSIFNHFL